MGSALDSASLIMYPSGYSDGVLGSAKPTDGSGDFTFTRGSNLSATRVGPNGYIEKGYENLLLQSNTFSDATWINQGSSYTITSGQSGYDGTNDAWLIDKSTTGNEYLRQSTSVSGVFTASIYAKAGTSNSVMIYAVGGYGTWDLSSGTFLSGGGNYISQSIDSVGNGWYRIQVTGNTTNVFYIQPKNSGASGAGSIYIQDAMLNQGLVAYPYIETTTAPVAGGILEDEPRIDFSDGCGHLLLEPSRTNILKHSEWIGGADQVNYVSVSIDDTISPEGYKNTNKLISNSTTLSNIRYLNLSYVSGVTYTFSAWIKNIDATSIPFLWYDANIQSTFDLINDVNTDSFTRVRYSFTTTKTTSQGQFQIARNLPLNESFYIYGAQLEQDATYPTSYIPTYGVSQTRLVDFFDSNADFTNFFGDNQGTIYIETDKRLFENLSTNEQFIGFRDDTKYWRIIGSQSVIFIQCSNWGLTIVHYPSTTNPTKYLFKWDGNNVSFYIDGSLIGSGTQTATFNPNQFGRTGNGVSMDSQEFLKQFTLFPTALSDSECIALTTI